VLQLHRLIVALLPLHPQDVDQEPLQEAMAPLDPRGELATLVGERDTFVLLIVQVALGGELLGHLGDAGRGQSQLGRDLVGLDRPLFVGQVIDAGKVILGVLAHHVFVGKGAGY
jgi:hypothetical protein